MLASCDGSSGDSLVGLGEEFDITALSDPVLRLCEVTECGDYSQSECEFYLRFDSLESARFSEDPEACFNAQVAQFNCLAEAGSCDEERCYLPAIAACQIEFISRAEIFLEDRGTVCTQSFIDFIVCMGGADVSCGADAEEEAEACPQETASVEANCFS